jgi:trimeric autotransporter adhesin
VALGAKPDAINFGDVYLGSVSKPAELTLSDKKNEDAPITISSIQSSTSEFSASQNCVGQLAAGVKCEVAITFAPVDTGLRTATLVIANNGTDPSRTIALKGTGKVRKAPTATPTATPVPGNLNINPSSGNFGEVTVGHDKSMTFRLTNSAQSGPPISFTSPGAFSVPPTKPQVFGFRSGATNCPRQLMPQKTCELTVQFIPAMRGVASCAPAVCAVTVKDNAANAKPTTSGSLGETILLSGSGE